MIRVSHRVYRVPGFLSTRPNWPPRPLSECCPTPPRFQGGRHTLLWRGAGGGANSDKGQTLWYSMYSIIPLRGKWQNILLRSEYLSFAFAENVYTAAILLGIFWVWGPREDAGHEDWGSGLLVARSMVYSLYVARLLEDSFMSELWWSSRSLLFWCFSRAHTVMEFLQLEFEGYIVIQLWCISFSSSWRYWIQIPASWKTNTGMSYLPP
jgi:hypothetical protein